MGEAKPQEAIAMKAPTSVLFASLALTAPGSADFIRFTHESTGSGTLAGVPFGLSRFVITATGDTDDRQSCCAGFWIDHATASIAIDGLGQFEILSPTRSFVSNGDEFPGFAHAGMDGAHLINGPSENSFGSWLMLDSIGATGPGALLNWAAGPVETTGGALVFDDALVTVIFEAEVPPACAPDCNSDQVLDLFDFLCFTNAFNGNAPYADCDESGGFDLFDFLCYTNMFNAGC
jgi:hypothetical protein